MPGKIQLLMLFVYKMENEYNRWDKYFCFLYIQGVKKQEYSFILGEREEGEKNGGWKGQEGNRREKRESREG